MIALGMCVLCFVLPSLGSTCTVFLFLLVAAFSGPLVFCSHQLLPTFFTPQSRLVLWWHYCWCSSIGYQKHCDQQVHADIITASKRFFLCVLSSYEVILKRLEGTVANCRRMGQQSSWQLCNYLLNGRKITAMYLKQVFSCLDSIASLFIQIRSLPGKQGLKSLQDLQQRDELKLISI